MVDISNIYCYFSSLGIKHSNNGFKYLMTAVRVGVEDIELCSKITTLYEKVAEIHSTTPANVERSIRYAIAGQATNNKEFILKAIYDLFMRDEQADALYTRRDVV